MASSVMGSPSSMFRTTQSIEIVLRPYYLILSLIDFIVPFWDSASQTHRLRHVENLMRGEKRYFISSPVQSHHVSIGYFGQGPVFGDP